MVIVSLPPKMRHVLKHQTWGLECVKCESLSHMNTENYLLQCPFPEPPLSILSNTYQPQDRVGHPLPMRLAGLAGRGPYSQSIIYTLLAKNQTPQLVPLRTGAGSGTEYTGLRLTGLRLQRQHITLFLHRDMDSASPTFPFSWDSLLLAIMKTNGCKNDSSFEVIFGAHLLVKQKKAADVFSLYF